MRSDRSTKALLALLSCREPDAPIPRVELSASEWNTLARAAVRHGVAPLVYARLSSIESSSSNVPEPTLDVMKGYFFRTGLENLRRVARVAPLLRALAEQGIGVIVLKGAFLAETVYRNPALRSMGDADILVHKCDLQRVTELLLALGWRQGPDIPTDPSRASGHQLPPFRSDSAEVDIHWNIENDQSPFSIDTDGLWERACEARIGGEPARALSPEDLVLHLCLHTAYNHGWLPFDGRLRALCDIAATMSHYAGRIDWNALVRRAGAWCVTDCVWLTLSLARDLLQVAVPGHVIEQLAPRDCAHGWLIDTAVNLTLNNHYATLESTLPTLSRPWCMRRWWQLPRGARWRRLLLPDLNSVAAAYPSLEGTALAPLRYLAYWADLGRDTARASFTSDGRELLSRERARMALGARLESIGRAALSFDNARLSNAPRHHDDHRDRDPARLPYGS